MSKSVVMTQGKPVKLLLSFALPLMLGNLFQQMYTVVDTAIVGRGVGLDALAALGTIDWLNWMFLGIATGFTQGFSVKVSQKYGEGDMEGLHHVIGQSAFLAASTAALVAVSMQFLLPVFLFFLRIPEEIIGMAEQYMRIMLGGFPLVMLYNFGAAVLRAVGDSKTPLKAMIIASVTNIVLDCVAVFVLKWGIAGAAAATIFSQGVSGTICFSKIRRTEALRFGRKDMKANGASCKTLLGLGAPIAAKNTIVSIGGMAIQTIVNGFGMSFIAGFTASNKLYGLLEIATLSYSFAVTTYVGQNYGAGKYDRIKSGMKAATLLSIATSLVIMVLLIVFGRPLTMLFISADSAEMMKAAGDAAYLYLVYMAVFLPVLYMLYAYQAALNGTGNTMASVVSGVIQLFLRVGISIIVGLTGYENGIFIAEVSAWCGGALYMVLKYYRSVHKAILVS
ncbi:MAG: MATE family efflux transporter [Lachnospiraceae bacterium]|nr:MATE family efflux transporter [Lachnospiraceae bacterium]